MPKSIIDPKIPALFIKFGNDLNLLKNPVEALAPAFSPPFLPKSGRTLENHLEILDDLVSSRYGLI